MKMKRQKVRWDITKAEGIHTIEDFNKWFIRNWIIENGWPK